MTCAHVCTCVHICKGVCLKVRAQLFPVPFCPLCRQPRARPRVSSPTVSCARSVRQPSDAEKPSPSRSSLDHRCARSPSGSLHGGPGAALGGPALGREPKGEATAPGTPKQGNGNPRRAQMEGKMERHFLGCRFQPMGGLIHQDSRYF